MYIKYVYIYIFVRDTYLPTYGYNPLIHVEANVAVQITTFTNIVLNTCKAVAAAPLTVPMSVPPGAAVVEFKACNMECA